jgi:hypothetical protein
LTKLTDGLNISALSQERGQYNATGPVAPPLKAVEKPLHLELAGLGLADQGRAVMSAAANGEIAPAQAYTLLTAVGTLSRVVEVEELVVRIEQLERDQKQGGSR